MRHETLPQRRVNRTHLRKPLYDRLWVKVTLPPIGEIETACWRWVGAFSIKRRGQKRPVIRLDTDSGGSGKVVLVARIVCGWYQGEPPADRPEAGHICPDGEQDWCVSPHHLRWMSRTENEQHKQRSRNRLDSARTERRQDSGQEQPAWDSSTA